MSALTLQAKITPFASGKKVNLLEKRCSLVVKWEKIDEKQKDSGFALYPGKIKKNKSLC